MGITKTMKLKLLQHRGIGSLHNRIAAARERLHEIQAHLNYTSNQEFIERESISVVEMTKWMNIQEKEIKSSLENGRGWK